MLTWRNVCTRVAVSLAAAAIIQGGSADAADIYVAQGDSLQAAIDNAQPGDRLLLAPGATFTGNFRLTDKGASTEFITIRSAAADALLPPDGVRISPADAFNLPIIKSPNTSPAMIAASGAHHWRLQFLEFQANDRGYGDIISLGSGSSSQTDLSQVPHHLVLDRLYIHGDPVIGQKRGVALHSGEAWIINSYISDMKGVGMDTQAISGYNGPGPWHVINNYLEASGENVLIGGASPPIVNVIPSDLTFERNHLFKPLEWRAPILAAPTAVSAIPGVGGSLPGGTYSYRVTATLKTAQDVLVSSGASPEVVVTAQAGGLVTVSWPQVPTATRYRIFRGTAPGVQDRYFETTATSFTDDGTKTGTSTSGPPNNGTLWSVKNILEFKVGNRVRVEGNLLEHCWQQSQSGYAIVLTPRNPNNTSPAISVRDVVITGNVVRGVGGGIALEGYDNHYPTEQSQRITVRNNLFDDVNSSRWGGSGRFIQIGSGPRDVTLDHNTVVHNGQIVYVYGGSLGQVLGFTLTNNLFKHNAYGIMGEGYAYGSASIAAYFPDGLILRNTLAGGSASRYPAGNEFPTVSYWQSQFVSYAEPDYRLVADSPYIASGTDGGDLGASVTDLYAAETIARSGSSAPAPDPAPVQIATQSLADGQAGTPYAATLTATGGSGSYTWSLTAGQLPAGLALAPDGTIAGTPLGETTASFSVAATDTTSSSNTATVAFSLHVNPAALTIVTSALPSGRAGSAYSATLAASGGTTPYTWHLSAGSLPPGLTLASTGTLSGTPTSGGTWNATIAVTDSSSSTLSAQHAYAIAVTAAPSVTVTTPVSGSTITGTTLQIAASASDSDGSVARVDFYAGAALVASASSSPWTAAWSNVAAGTYVISAIATDDSGLTGTSAPVTVTVAAAQPAAPPPVTGEIVLYAADAAHLVGRWSRVADSTAASGYKLSNANLGLEANTASANPVDYFETTFTAPAGTRYHVWVRMRAGNNHYANDSLWVQFSDGVNAAGQPLYRLGTTDALLLSLEACSGCGVSGWGWVDGAPWLAQTEITFASGGTHIVRMQQRQDGAEVDQIVLIPAPGGTTAPGAVRDDTTILPRSGQGPADVVVYASDVADADVHGRWSRTASQTSPNGVALTSADRNKTIKTALASPADYFEVTVPAYGNTPYRVWLRMRASRDKVGNDSVFVQYSDALVDGSSAYGLSTTSAQPFNLAECSACGVSGWGWQDHAYWQDPTTISFSFSGLHTIRIQTREDGAEIDQIVLSPARYLTAAPGAAMDDGTIVEKP